MAVATLPIVSVRRHSAGFTLIELMVAVLVSGIVILGVFAFSSIQRTNAAVHERDAKVNQAIEGAMMSMGQDVRQAGLGFARLCSELRIWDGANSRLLNPGGPADPNDAVTDPVTGEYYWVLRDGIQVHWRGGGDTPPDGGMGTSAAPGSSADSFDVIMAEPGYLGSPGVFALAAAIDPADPALVVETSSLLDSGNSTHLDQVRQLFPPGGFVIVMRNVGSAQNPLAPPVQSQCVLLQVTSDVAAGASAQQWRVPIEAWSMFNSDLDGVMAENVDVSTLPCAAETPPCQDDWEPAAFAATATVVPVGRLRWSRYELDYSVPRFPYLVRYDIIGHRPGMDVDNLGGVDYPHCAAGACPASGLHLPVLPPDIEGVGPAAVAIAPMIEDLQVAAGCDGWSTASANDLGLRPPDDPALEDVGPADGPIAGSANNVIDENSTESGQRGTDEWVGNALIETSAPDCVIHGTGEYHRDTWAGLEMAPEGFRMSPQAVRITLMASGEMDEAAGGLASADLDPIEDRPAVNSVVGARSRVTLTERFSPDNLRWRDPSLQ